MKDRLIQLAHRIETSPVTAASVTVGFDAVVDRLERPVRSMDGKQNRTYFSTIGEFGRYLTEKDGLSCVIELHPVIEKIGGNMANLAATLGKLGVSTDCVGTLGLPDPSPIFLNAFGPNCRVHSVGPYGQCLALEFNTGKVMFAQMGEAATLTYDQIERRLGKAQLDKLFGEAQVLGLLNWSELYFSTDTWQNIFHRHICPSGRDLSKHVLIDITDFSRATHGQIRELFELIRQIGQYRSVTLSLNRNEATLLGEYLELDYSHEDWIGLSNAINQYAQTYCTVIHLLAESAAATAEGTYHSPGFWVQEPVISTGGGDNYNAGLVLSMLLKLPVDDAMLLANATANFYVSTGRGPTRSELISHLRTLAQAKEEK